MVIIEFEKQMKKILRKASEASDMNLEWVLVSGDPDCVADFGKDAFVDCCFDYCNMFDEYNVKCNGISGHGISKAEAIDLIKKGFESKE